MGDAIYEVRLECLDGDMRRVERKVDELLKRPVYQGKKAKHVQSDVDDGTVDFSMDENEDRGNWTGRFDFLLSCLGYAVGLGNVWRFPYLCYRNGGGAFFIPYCIMLVFVGIPIFFLELSLGQFTSSGPFTCWSFAPMFTGVGVAMVIVSGLVAIYYNMIIAWSLFYMFASFTSELPWSSCDLIDGADRLCSTFLSEVTSKKNCTDNGPGFMANITDGICYNGSMTFGIWNETQLEEVGLKRILPAEEYLYGRALGRKYSEGLHDLGPIRWELALCLLLGWIIVFFSLIKGVKSSGKVVYFTATFPYIVLTILLVRGLTLPNMADGIRFYLNPDLDRLKDAGVWKDAAVQIFFSLSASWGGLITLASYNRFHTDALRDSLIVSLGNCLTSFYAGFVIFSLLGFLAGQLGTTVDKVASSGVGLAFIVYPEAVVRMPLPTLWAILFFVMLLTLGLDSQFALVETVTTAFVDKWPDTLRPRKTIVILGTSVIMYLLGLTMCTNGGAWLLQLMDEYSGGWNVLLISLCECMSIAWVYGFLRFRKDIGVMLGNKFCGCIPWLPISWWWAVCWCFITPLGVLFIMVFSWVRYTPLKYDWYIYPTWAQALGWLMTFSVICGLIITPIVQLICCRKGSCGDRCKSLVYPTRGWGPALLKHRKLIDWVPMYTTDIEAYKAERDGGMVPMGGVDSKEGTVNPGYAADNDDKTAF
ncbi:sodium-dependent proline transporter-like [Lineus longissimus]|uniref:sodium-dependent proline transporter-like n=1 Tax=Lineus longissimus TaxID=88925 RepID=UPI002B4D7068